MLHQHFHIPVSFLAHRRNCVVWLPRKKTEVRSLGHSIQPYGRWHTPWAVGRWGHHLSLGSMSPFLWRPRRFRHNPMSSAKNQASETPHRANTNVLIQSKETVCSEKTWHLGGPRTALLFSRQIILFLPQPILCSQGHTELDLWTQSELCPFTPLTSCLTVGLWLHLSELHLSNGGVVGHIAPIGLWRG